MRAESHKNLLLSPMCGAGINIEMRMKGSRRLETVQIFSRIIALHLDITITRQVLYLRDLRDSKRNIYSK